MSASSAALQMDLFNAVLTVYQDKGDVSNVELYGELVTRGVVESSELRAKAPVGRDGKLYSLGLRKIRWYQQTLKQLGLIEKVPGTRGAWRASMNLREKDKLTPAPAGVALVAFSTKLGVALWGDCRTVFQSLDEPIHLALTSPPYCLAQPRAYGNPTQSEYVDFICESLEPIVRNLAPGGSICLNVSNDIFDPGMPSRSLVRERLVLALHDRLGLHRMDELIWVNESKAPGPIAWASKKRVQLNVAWEPIYWFALNPELVQSDNRRVLQPHKDRHLKLIQQGGEKREAVFADGANRIKPGAFGAPTEGRIPRNVIFAGHRCSRQTPARNAAKAAGIPVHGAAMPFAVADFLVKFMTVPGQLVVDNFGGYMTTAEAAEVNGRRWLSTDIHFEYPWAGSHRFESADGFERLLAL